MIYSVRRFSEERKKESHTLRNTLIGAGALAGGILAGKAGYLGTGVQRSIGKGITGIGSTFGSQKMVQSGFKTQAKANVTEKLNVAKNQMSNMNLTKKQRAAAKARVDFLGNEQNYNQAVDKMTNKFTTGYNNKLAQTQVPTTPTTN